MHINEYPKTNTRTELQGLEMVQNSLENLTERYIVVCMRVCVCRCLYVCVYMYVCVCMCVCGMKPSAHGMYQFL